MTVKTWWTPPKSLLVLFVSAIGWFVVMTLLWMQVSAWTSYPVAGLARVVLENGASYWVQSVHIEPGHIEADTRIAVAVAGMNASQGMAHLVAEAAPAHYAYGLPLFFALLLAARGKHLLKNALSGYVILLVPQTYSLVLELLRQIMVAGGRPGALAIDQWQMEAIAMGYQVGSLLMPTLAPVALWLWFEQELFAKIASGWAMTKKVASPS